MDPDVPVPVDPSVPLLPVPDDEPSPVVPDVLPFEPVPLDESVPVWLGPLLELSDDDPLFPDVDPLVVLLDVPLEVDESVEPLVVLSLPSVVVSSFESVESDLGFCTGACSLPDPESPVLSYEGTTFSCTTLRTTVSVP